MEATAGTEEMEGTVGTAETVEVMVEMAVI